MNLAYLLALAGVAAAIWAFANWRKGLQAALYLLVIEGALRKWAFPGAQEVIYFAKDILLIGVYLGFLGAPAGTRRKLPVPPVVQLALALSLLIGLLQVFNPRLPNILVGIVGFKAYFLYIPLLWVVPAAFRDDRELVAFLRRYVIVAIPVGLLAVAQFFSPPTSALNTYARSGLTPDIVTFGITRQVRVTATFSFITGYASYVLTIAILALALLAASRWRYRGNLLVFAALGLTLLGMLMTGSRAPVFLLLLLLPLYWWLGLAREGAQAVGRFLLAASLLAVLVNYVGSDAVEAFYIRAASATDAGSRVLSPFIRPFELAETAGVAGYGIGATHQAAEAVTKRLIPYSWLPGIILEDEPSRIMLELGIFGFFATYVLRISLIIISLYQVFVLRTRFHHAIATSCVLFFLAHLPGGVVFNVTADVYYWFFAGLLLAAMQADRLAVQRSAAAPAPLLPRPAPAEAFRGRLHAR